MSLLEEIACVKKHLQDAIAYNPQRPLFILAYGVIMNLLTNTTALFDMFVKVDNYVSVSEGIAKEMASDLDVIGAQDLSALGRAAKP